MVGGKINAPITQSNRQSNDTKTIKVTFQRKRKIFNWRTLGEATTLSFRDRHLRKRLLQVILFSGLNIGLNIYIYIYLSIYLSIDRSIDLSICLNHMNCVTRLRQSVQLVE